MIYEYEELRAMPTLHQGYAANLKVDNGTLRIWLSRMSLADGELHPIQVERLVNGRWEDVTCIETHAQGQICRHAVHTPTGIWRHPGR
jgi:hypothetical protein